MKKTEDPEIHKRLTAVRMLARIENQNRQIDFFVGKYLFIIDISTL